MAETKNLYQKLLAITEEIGKITKTGRNTTQGYNFIEQAQVVAEVRVQLAKHGVMIIPETTDRRMTTFTNAKGTTMIHANVTSRYTLVNADNPEDRMICDWDAGEALDTSDKATNKATTASHKYFLMKLFNISDKDDPDSESPVAPTPEKPLIADTMTQEQILELMELAKKKGKSTKDAAVAFLDELAGGPFTKVPGSQFEAFKKVVIQAGWNKAEVQG